MKTAAGFMITCIQVGAHRAGVFGARPFRVGENAHYTKLHRG